MSEDNITAHQLAIALAKIYHGTRPGDDMWCEYDYQALEFALGHPVDRIPTRFEQEPTNV